MNWTESIVATAEDIDGTTCYKTNVAFDKQPVRRVFGKLNIETVFKMPGYGWRGVSDRNNYQRYQVAFAAGQTAKNWVYYQDYSGDYGAPLAADESWTYTVVVESDAAGGLGDSTTLFSVMVASDLESVTTPARTFPSCYKVAHMALDGASAGKSTIDWWDSTGEFDLAPVKTIDYYNFNQTEERVLTEYPSSGPTTYSLITDSSTGGSVTTPSEGTFGPYNPGDSVDLVATPDAGYVFDGWTGDVADPSAASTTITMNADYSVTANFAELVQYELIIASGDNGSVTTPGEGTHGPYDGGISVDLVATPDVGYMFNGWIGDTAGIADTNAASTTVTMNGDYSITANFVELVQYELMTANSGNGSVTIPGEGASNHNAGSVVNLVATPDAGYMFDRWTGDIGDIADPFAASTTITMNSDYSITANFVEAPEAWNCPVDHVALIAPYPGAGRAEIGSPIQIGDMFFSGEWFMILELDEGSGAWYTYYSGFTTGNTLTELEPGKFYYVVVSEPGSLYL